MAFVKPGNDISLDLAGFQDGFDQFGHAPSPYSGCCTFLDTRRTTSGNPQRGLCHCLRRRYHQSGGNGWKDVLTGITKSCESEDTPPVRELLETALCLAG